MRIVVFLHVLTMFAAVALSYGSITLLWIAARRRDVESLRGIVRTVGSIAGVIGPIYMLGIVLGILAVFSNGWNPTQGWLLVAYGLTALAVLSASAVVSPWLKRIDSELVAAGPDGAAMGVAAVVPAGFSDGRLRVLLLVDAAIIVALIADMVLKPF